MAGDDAQLDVAGFTADGRYFIFEQYGVTLELERPYAHVVVIDTHTGRRVKPAARFNGKEKALRQADEEAFKTRMGMMEVRKRAWKFATKYFDGVEAYKVFPPRRVEFYREPALVQKETGNRKIRAFFGPKVKSNAPSKKTLTGKERISRRFEVRLFVKNPVTDDAQRDAFGDCVPFVLRGELIDHKSGRSVNLASERVAPKWRKCMKKMSLADIYVDRGRIAVMLSYEVPATDGADLRYMALSKKLPE